MQARSGSGLPDPPMTGDPSAAGMRWLSALVADGGWLADEGRGLPRLGRRAIGHSRPPKASPALIAGHRHSFLSVARSGAAPRHTTLAGLCYPVNRRIFTRTSEIIARANTACMMRCLPQKDSNVSARHDSAATRDPVMIGPTCPAGTTFPGPVSS